MHQSVLKHRNEIAALCQQHGVSRLEVFGSAARGLDFDESASDVDLIASFDAGHKRGTLADFLAFSLALESLLGRKVDLIEDVPVRNTRLKRSIDASRELVYAA